jgi:hypothetical protein
LASYVIGLANATGWSEHFILWELPLARGLQYQHAAICLNGGKTIPTKSAAAKEAIDVVHELETAKATWQLPS